MENTKKYQVIEKIGNNQKTIFETNNLKEAKRFASRYKKSIKPQILPEGFIELKILKNNQIIKEDIVDVKLPKNENYFVAKVDNETPKNIYYFKPINTFKTNSELIKKSCTGWQWRVFSYRDLYKILDKKLKGKLTDVSDKSIEQILTFLKEKKKLKKKYIKAFNLKQLDLKKFYKKWSFAKIIFTTKIDYRTSLGRDIRKYKIDLDKLRADADLHFERIKKNFNADKLNRKNCPLKLINKSLIKDLKKLNPIIYKNALFVYGSSRFSEDIQKRADKLGVYPVAIDSWALHIALPTNECRGRYFDANKLANTLMLQPEEVELLKSEGKTYLFKTNALGYRIQLFHADLSCNDLHIAVIFENIEEKEKKFKENKDKWLNAPYARKLGQSDDPDHYVC
jgi:hypothetical protein